MRSLVKVIHQVFPSKYVGFRVITKIIVKINKVKFPQNDVISNDDELIKEAWSRIEMPNNTHFGLR